MIEFTDPKSGQSHQTELRTCHFFTMLRSLSVVKSIPWKLVNTLVPWTSSAIKRNLRNDLSASSSFCKSANDTSNTRPFKPSDAISEKWNLKLRSCWRRSTCTVHPQLTSSLSTIDQGFTNLTIGEHTRSLHIVPVLTSEWIHTVRKQFQLDTYTYVFS